MKIILDAFGGDNAPLAVLQGAADAVAKADVEILLAGDETKIRQCAADHNIALDGMEILQADDVMDMHDEPNEILKSKSNTSLAVGLKALADGQGDAFVSAGSTGAVLFGATFIVKRIKGIKRPALAPVMPTTKAPYLLIDCGANVSVRPEMLQQFALLGSAYMEKVMGVQNPRVGLLNNGAEDSKGGDMLVETYALLKETKNIHFIGNVEARDVPTGACDVLVTDGFSGNIVLKLTEGVAMSFMGMFKKVLTKNIKTKIAAMLIMPEMKQLKKSLDYSEYGGAPLLGIAKPVIKAHGSSNAKAITIAILQAKTFVENQLIETIKDRLKA